MLNAALLQLSNHVAMNALLAVSRDALLIVAHHARRRTARNVLEGVAVNALGRIVRLKRIPTPRGHQHFVVRQGPARNRRRRWGADGRRRWCTDGRRRRSADRLNWRYKV